MANVTEAKMEAYLGTFHEEYVGTVERYVPEESRRRLLRYSLLPAQITGYVSTQLGAGYEYFAGDDGISVRRSSRRIEELFIDAPPSVARLGPMIALAGTNTGIAGMTLEGAFPFRFADDPADVFFHDVRFKVGTWSRDVLYAQLFTSRHEEFWSEAEAVRRARDDILPALLDLHRSAARNVDLATYLRTLKQRTVLVLGDFKGGRDRLEAIRGALEARGYDAVLLDDVPDDLNYDLPQKFHALSSVSRFLVFEDSTPSGHIGEMFLADPSHPIRIVLREGERQSTFMTRAMGLTSRVYREWTYDAGSLDAVVAEAVEWAEALVTELARQRAAIYPWRETGELAGETPGDAAS